ncbi:Tyrosine kinase-like (TKL) protein [Toxoplasma gondii VAND]|uniref:non-specific serine/threonine protein kinase n=3 Tax=Toxoplasma gondii TaxID=5811 RepID=A0A425HVD0_TOXGO|nr:Tyrosine kinase-like (TKL) protein [Toxoplasma gondii VAND]PUA84857.1 Tyrosine kinase-like (TKL) protein [Toxoplasma gondii TgCATBr9]RQX70147.1 Tyrosine kinase-like (TKL) protein [Toxoplasma gondii CAST]
MQTFKQFCTNWVAPALQFGQRQYVIGTRTLREERQLSEGGFGFVSCVRDVSSGETFALKRILCQEKERYRVARAEAKLMESLPPHPNIVGFFGAAVETVAATSTTGSAREVLLLLELCEGGHLLDLLDRHNGSLKEEWILHIVKEITAGLAHLHSQPTPVAHRDLKIENVLCCEKNRDSEGRREREDKRGDKGGREEKSEERTGETPEGKSPLDFSFKLCDFGSSNTRQVDTACCSREELLRTEDEIERNTTLMYRPPEMVDVYRGLLIGPQADMWMLGCILYTLCFFRHPFQDASSLAIANANYTVPSNKYSEELIDLLHWLLSADPNDRPTSAQLLSLLDSSSLEERMRERRQCMREGRRRGDKAGRRRAEKKEKKPSGDAEEKQGKQKSAKSDLSHSSDEQSFAFPSSTHSSDDLFSTLVSNVAPASSSPHSSSSSSTSNSSSSATNSSSSVTNSSSATNSSSSATNSSSSFLLSVFEGSDSAWFPSEDSWQRKTPGDKETFPSGFSGQNEESWQDSASFFSWGENGGGQSVKPSEDFFGGDADPFLKTEPLEWGEHTVPSFPGWCEDEKPEKPSELENDSSKAPSRKSKKDSESKSENGTADAWRDRDFAAGGNGSSSFAASPSCSTAVDIFHAVSSSPSVSSSHSASSSSSSKATLSSPVVSSRGVDDLTLEQPPRSRSQLLSSPTAGYNTRRVSQAPSPFNARAVSLSFPQGAPPVGTRERCENAEDGGERQKLAGASPAPFDLFGDFCATSAAAAAAHHKAAHATTSQWSAFAQPR